MRGVRALRRALSRDAWDLHALRRYVAENRRRVVPVAMAVLLGVAAVALVGAGLGSEYTASVQLDVSTAGQDAALAQRDADGDGLSDLEEIFTYGSDPQRADTDGDGIPDAWEARHREYDAVSNTYAINPLLNDSREDRDGDGATNLEEHACGTDPTRADSDGDGMGDAYECRFGLDNAADDAAGDPDEDGLTNLRESRLGTDPFSADSDGDTIPDVEEVESTTTDPARYSTAGHGISDGWLVHFDVDAEDKGVAFLDPDGDGLTHHEEFRAARERLNPGGQRGAQYEDYGSWLDPRDRDTDGDGMDDGWEVRYDLDPLDVTDADLDFDGDGLTNRQEFDAGANPRESDGDGDGLTDREEAVEGWTVAVDGEDVDVYSDPARADSDGDFLSDQDERQGFAVVSGRRVTLCPDGPCALDPSSPDTDLDGLSDFFEATYTVTPKLDPTAADSDGDGLLDRAELDLWSALRQGATDEALSRILDQGELASCQGVDADTSADTRAALDPKGDVDGDGVPNVVDADADCDGISDGDEADPPRRAAAPGSEDTYSLPATSPALVDSDGDDLPDPWENEFAQWDYGLGDWNLNASNPDSLRLNDGRNDGDRDLDEDGVDYAEGYVRPWEYVHNNREEFRAGTHPNLRDSDGDGIHDGWEVHFARVGVVEGVTVHLDPLDATDANATSKTASYVRLAEVVNGVVDIDAANETEVARYQSVPTVDGGERDVARVEGTFALTYRMEFEHATDPTRTDTDGDGMPDAWEVRFLLQASDARTHFNPADPSGADLDYDGDGLTNADEARHGTDPTVADSDLGGIPDGEEVAGEVTTDPLDPNDDNPSGDVDNDGLSNVAELEAGTRVVEFDTDRDGLLDGQDIPAASLPADVADRFRAGGVAEVTRSGGAVFLGEGSQGPPTDPAAWDTDGDEVPDGWEAYYAASEGNDPTKSRNDNDQVTDAQEYALGRPDHWSEARDGVWWLGGNPGTRDTDCDGDEDGYLDGTTGDILGWDFDYDNDGLNDFIGEDPYPFFDQANSGAVDPRDPAFIADFVWGGGRCDTATVDEAPADGAPDHEQAVTPAFEDVNVTFLDGDKTLLKGGRATVQGRLVVDGGAPPEGVAVVVNLWNSAGLQANGDPGRVLGVGFTDGDGRFTVDVALQKERSAQVPAGAVVFGERAPADGATTVDWALDTSAFAPGYDYRVVLWSYGVAPSEGRYDYTTTVGGSQVAAPGLKTTFDTPHVVDTPVRVRSEATVELPPRLSATNGGEVKATARLVDAAGDHLSGFDLRVMWQGEALARGTTGDNGSFTFTAPVGTFDTPGARDLRVVFDGTDLVSGAEATTDLFIVFPTALTATVENTERTAVAGRSLPITGRLTDVGGAPVAGAEVSVEFQGDRFTDATDASGDYRVLVRVPNEAVAGNRPVVATFAGNDLYAPSSRSAGVVVVKQLAKVHVVEARGVLGEPITLRGELRDLAGIPARDPTLGHALEVTVWTGSHRATAAVDNDTGAFETVVPADAVAGPGPMDVRATFAGSPLYEGSETTATVPVTTGARIELPPAKVTRGGVTAVEGRLVDARGDGVAGQPVAVEFDASPLGTAVTDATGAFRAEVDVPADYPLGSALVRATFDGGPDGFLLPADPASATYQVRAATELTLENGTLPTGLIPVRGSLVDDAGRPLVSAEVHVSFRGAQTTTFTDFRGRFEAVFDGHGIPAREYTVAAEYTGSNRHAPATALEAINVLADTELTVTSVDPAVRGKPFTVRGALATTEGLPVHGAAITATLNGTPVARGMTDQDGRFLLEGAIPRDTARGDHLLRVAFAGDANHVPAAKVSTVAVRAEPHIRLVVPEKLSVGDEFTGQVMLTDDRGEPIPHSSVRVRFSGYRYPFTLTTNDTGVATFPGRVTSAGTAEVDVRFTGNQALLPQSQGTSIVASGGALSAANVLPVLAAMGALALLAAGAVGYLRWRGGAVEEARRIFRDAEVQLAAGNEYAAVVMNTYRALVDLVQRYGGAEDRPELTAAEFANAIRGTLPVSAARLDALVGLFEEARYSHHAIGPAERDRAVRHFREIQKDLATRGPAAGAPPGGEAA